jgi:hypothetical protein
MKRLYALCLLIIVAVSGNVSKIYAGSCSTVINTFDVLDPTDPIYPFGIVTGSYSGSASLDGELFYEGSLLYPYSSSDGTILLFDLNPGSYEFFYCGGTLSQTFTVAALPCDISILSIGATNVSGAGCTPNGAIDLTVGSSTPGQTFFYNITELFTQAEYTGQDDGFGIISLGGLPAGTYTVFVSTESDVLNSTCNANDLIIITEPSCDMAFGSSGVSDVSAINANDGAITIEVSGTSCIPTAPGGNPFYNVYAELNGSFFSNLTFNPANGRYEINNLIPGNYTVIADNAGSGCFVSTNLTVGGPICNLTPPTINASTTTLCNGSFAFLSASSAFVGYQWIYNNTSLISFPDADLSIFKATIEGSYSVKVTDINGCVAVSNPIVLTAPLSPPINFPDTIYACDVQAVVEAPISFDTYLWSTLENSSSITVANEGWYALAASVSSLLCGVVDTFFVSLNNTPPTAQIDVIGANPFCQGASITLQSSSTTGNSWSNGATTQSISVNTAGTYTLTVTNTIGCKATTSVNATTQSCISSTQVTGGVCGQSDLNKNAAIFCTAVNGATQYEWEFSNANGVYATRLTTSNFVLLQQVTPVISWGTSWTLRVRAYNGAVAGNYSPNCNFSILPDPAIFGVPTTQLRPEDCSLQNYTINTRNRMIANYIPAAVQYEFQFSDPASGNIIATVQRTFPVLFLNTMTPTLPFPAQYNVRVRARVASTWSPFGPACLIGIVSLNREDGSSQEELPYENESFLINEPFFTLSVAPNPYENFTSITINSSENENIFIQLFDMTGKVVDELNVTSNERFNTGAGLSKGIYLIKARSENGKLITSRLVKTN